MQDMANTISELRATVSDLKQKISRKKPEIDSELKKEIRHTTKKLAGKGDQLDLHSSINDPHNQSLLKRIAEGACGSDSLFNEEQAMEAAQRHFTNLKVEMTRRVNGTKPKHSKSMRRTSRKDSKLKFRMAGLNHPKCPLTPQDKEDARAIMTVDYMSSDEDEVFTGAGGQKYRQVRFRPWESEKAARIKAVTYDTYVQHLVGKRDIKKVHALRRDENSKPSDASLPNGAPDWAVNLDFVK